MVGRRQGLRVGFTSFKVLLEPQPRKVGTALRCRRQRNEAAAFAPSHCKVMTLRFVSGERYVIEGSANLCSKRSREQFMLLNDDTGALYEWHRRMILEMVQRDGPGDQLKHRCGNG